MNARNMISAIARIFFWMAVFLGVLELLSRLLWPYDLSLREVMRRSDDPSIIFELKPGSETVFTGQNTNIPATTIRVSQQGIRDRQYPLKKEKGVYRIIVVGDSVSFGWGVESEQTFPKYLESMLNKDGRQKYEVINFSVPGYNTVQEVATLRNKCLAYNPDLIIFSVCGNDYQPSFNYLFPCAFLEHVPACFYKSRLFSGLVGQFVSWKDRKSSHDLRRGLKEMDKAVGELKELAEARKLDILFYRGNERYIKDVLERHGFSDRIINLGRGYFEQECTIKGDRHLNAEGHKRAAEDIYFFLKKDGYVK